MHETVRTFFKGLKKDHPDWFKGVRVLEYGSKNINGSVRDYFEDCDYVGVNRGDGKDVDVVCEMDEYTSDKQFDTVVSSSSMEHDKRLWDSLEVCWGLLRDGGVFLGTTTCYDFPEHCSDEGEDNHYCNIDPVALHAWLQSRSSKVQYQSGVGDHNGGEIWFWATKPV